jgi:hypothetical protein
VAYGAALERRFGSNPIEGSNPSPSATNNLRHLTGLVVVYIERFGYFDLNSQSPRTFSYFSKLLLIRK